MEEPLNLQEVIDSITQKVAETCAVPKDLLNPSASTRISMIDTIAGYLESLNTKHALINEYSIGDAWTIVGYYLTKQGHAYETRNGCTPEATQLHKDFLFKSKKHGPHRPRRIARKLMRQRVGMYIQEFGFTPVAPLNYISVRVIAEPLSNSSQEL